MDIKSKILEEAEANGANVINLADAMEKCPLLSRVIKACENKLVLDIPDIEGVNFDNELDKMQDLSDKLNNLSSRGNKLNNKNDFFAVDNSDDGKDCTLTCREGGNKYKRDYIRKAMEKSNVVTENLIRQAVKKLSDKIKGGI